ncbi:peptidylprolyl isomerase [Marinicauda salina]|uniref:Parvulin-like PPIase n=1 Tax=Marinicauda salina TaxID=2135793 RepID=A0A2U2BS09_9PROT|nr:peptidylprolyl isomerase [Marinicauda salina]PWE16807.1 peptidylprolyl isomerase [Marinicauda salina]
MSIEPPAPGRRRIPAGATPRGRIAAVLAAVCAFAAAACSAEPDVDTEPLVDEAETRGGDVAFRFLDLPPQDADDAVAARVGETVIYESDVRREAAAQEIVEDPAALDPSDAAFQEVLDELIEQRLLALEARRRGLADSPEARRRLAAAEERIIGNVLVETAVSDAVTEDAIERVYEEQMDLAPAERELRARHILVDTREEAREIARLLSEGRDFAQLARQVSQDPNTRLEGGDLGWFTRDGILPEFARIAFSLPVGGVSEPFQTEYGWHVLEVTDRRNRPRPGLEEMRARIVRFLTLEGIRVLLDEIRETYPVTRVASPAPPGLRAPTSESDGAEGDDGTASQGNPG